LTAAIPRRYTARYSDVTSHIWKKARMVGEMDQDDVRPDTILTTLDRGLTILETLAREQGTSGLTLTELSHLLRMNRSTLFRFLATLRARGYIARDDETDRYRLGVRILLPASTFLSDLDVRRVAKPFLEALCDRIQELVHLTTLDGNEIVTVERVLSKQTLALQTAEIGARRPVHTVAAGKATLAYLPQETVQKILAAGMPASTPHTITDPAVLIAQLDDVRTRGYAWDDQERTLGVRCVAAPVFGYDGKVLATISVAAPTIRTSMERLWELGEETRAAAAGVSERLGFRRGAGRTEAAGG
jgi:DNA-binding IclR family transcriptional regulator